jgi:polysaccharide deacetylase family protein (PEP-CTERM system associated)
MSAAQGPPALLNSLTVDVEDYFHVSAFEGIIDRSQWDQFESRVELGTRKLLDLCSRAGIQGTFFVLGWVADRHPQLVREIDAAGHEIGCHSYWHRLIYQQTAGQFRQDLRRSRNLLEDIIGKPVVAYRAPSFSITQRSLWAFDILIEEGFVIDSSIYPTFHDRYGIPGTPLHPHQIVRPAGVIHEFPLSIYRLCGYPLPIGGGGYFRLYPYFFTRHGLAAINAEGRPFSLYVHPWELDTEQPRMPVGGFKAFRHYVNLHQTESRLVQLLRDFSLGTLSEVLASLSDQEGLARRSLNQVA